jgi:alcohol dehydrogenase YqhD (iron-dependent ADH family)
MENFNIYNPVKLHFGKESYMDIAKNMEKYGKRVLLIYGKSSIQKIGLYDKVLNLLSDFEIFEYPGIKPNPLYEDADRAVEYAKRNNVDIVLGIGGGSVIDTAKMVAFGLKADVSVWDIMTGKHKPKSALPIFAILTLAATGTEMNQFAVLQNHKDKRKIGYGHRLMYPKHSYLDPQITTTVPANHTTNGIVDLLAHALEAFFGAGDAPLSDKIVFALFKEMQEISHDLLNDLENYELRARLMYAATLALNGTTMNGRATGDWGVHSIGHVLSLLYDTPHAASLSIAELAWMKLNIDKLKSRIQLLGKEVFNVNTADECIFELEKFFKSINSPIRLNQIGLSKDNKAEIIEQFGISKIGGANIKISEEDYAELFDLMLE